MGVWWHGLSETNLVTLLLGILRLGCDDVLAFHSADAWCPLSPPLCADLWRQPVYTLDFINSVLTTDAKSA